MYSNKQSKESQNRGKKAMVEKKNWTWDYESENGYQQTGKGKKEGNWNESKKKDWVKYAC